jgi:hypothetical protein
LAGKESGQIIGRKKKKGLWQETVLCNLMRSMSDDSVIEHVAESNLSKKGMRPLHSPSTGIMYNSSQILPVQ